MKFSVRLYSPCCRGFSQCDAPETWLLIFCRCQSAF